jgi:hypothetical protein
VFNFRYGKLYAKYLRPTIQVYQYQNILPFQHWQLQSKVYKGSVRWLVSLKMKYSAIATAIPIQTRSYYLSVVAFNDGLLQLPVMLLKLRWGSVETYSM